VSEFIHPYSLQLSGYSKGVRLQYRDYLQAKSLVGDITDSVKKVEYSISESSREMIGTMEQIHKRGYGLVAASISEAGSQISESLSEGFETVSWNLDEISEGIDALNAKFDWGFGRMIAGIGELVAIAKTPAETWAHEQYEIARDAIRRGLYPEAVEALLKAVDGHGDHVGYKLEYRFHHMLGILYLGDVENTDPAILDLVKAEASFLTAARYAKTDHPNESGIALTAAGWAAYCRGRPEEAESHTQKAIAMHHQHGEAFYQLGKIQMYMERPREAIPNLRRAAELDAHYTIRAATDPDYLKYETDLQNLLDALRQEAERLATASIGEAKCQLATLEEWRAEKVFEPEMTLLDTAFVEAQRAHSANTFLGYLDAKSTADRLTGLAKRLQREQRQHFENEVNSIQGALARAQSDLRSMAEQCLSPSFRRANELLDQAQGGVNTHTEYTRKMELLNQAQEALRQSTDECHREIERRKSSARIKGNILGAIVGYIVIIIPLHPIANLLGSLISIIPWAMSKDKNAPGSYERLYDPITEVLFLAGAVTACMIGAEIFRQKFLTKHKAFVRSLGFAPSFSGFVKIARPAPLFDEHFVRTGKPQSGRTYRGSVTKIEPDGAFVEFLPGQIGFVCINEFADSRLRRVEDIVKVGDEIYVKHIGTDENGRVRLSRKQAEPPTAPPNNDLG
jgi:tetratricopeptide (TPR) repeat protein